MSEYHARKRRQLCSMLSPDACREWANIEIARGTALSAAEIKARCGWVNGKGQYVPSTTFGDRSRKRK